MDVVKTSSRDLSHHDADVDELVAKLPPVPVRRGLRKWYASPVVQVCMISLVCFGCPGMFNALSALGGGGQVDATASNNGSVALYSTFAVTSFFAGAITNRLGSRLTLALGAMGYSLYIGSFLSYNIHQNGNFVVAAGAILGLCASLLWCAQGSMVLAYATEQTKGRLFALFWAIFNLGAVIGAAIEFGLTYDSSSNTVSNTVYAVFIAISGLASFLPALLVDPRTMVRSDGTRVIMRPHPILAGWKTEIVGLYECLRADWVVILLFPYFLSSNWQYTWTFNDYNGALFDLPTRSLQALLYWSSQIVGAGLFGIFIDSNSHSRVRRAWAGLILVLVFVMVVWGGCYHLQKSYTRADIGKIPRISFRESSTYAKYAIVYVLCGIMDSLFQNYAYWLMGAFSNNAPRLAYLVGLYKSAQSAGAAIVFRLDSNLVPYMTMLAVSWALAIFSILCAAPAIALRVRNHSDEKVVLADGAVVDVDEVLPSPVKDKTVDEEK